MSQTNHHPTTGLPSPWLISPASLPNARRYLVCFPSAGGGAVQYRLWLRQLPPDTQLWAVQLPGRERRLREPPQRRLDEVVAAVGEALGPQLDRPFAIFGHSMGALLAFELARWLRRRGGPMPMHLLLSGRRAPQIDDADRLLHTLDDHAFLCEIVRRYNGIPDAILAEPELLELFLPTLRADMEIIETYRYQQEPPLACPITVFAGLDDRRVGQPELEGWRIHTTGAFRVRQFPGGHFYLQQERGALLEEIGRALTQTPRPGAF